MPVNVAALAGAGLGTLQQSKLEKAASGQKVYTAPRTFFGKVIGGVTGRTAAAKVSAESKTNIPNTQVMNSLSPARTTPVTGGITFGGEAAKKTYLPFAIVAGVVAIFFFMRKKGRGRRR